MENDEAIGGTHERLGGTLWVRHQAEHVAAFIQNTGDVAHRAVGIVDIAECDAIFGFSDALQYTVYGPGHKFDWHVDIGAGAASNRKLSMTIQLSDASAYEGGALQFISAPDLAMPKTRGTAVLFPAYLAHRVSDVTSGIRHSLVGWAAGAPFR